MSDLFSNLAERVHGGTPALSPLHSFYRAGGTAVVPAFDANADLESGISESIAERHHPAGSQAHVRASPASSDARLLASVSTTSHSETQVRRVPAAEGSAVLYTLEDQASVRTSLPLQDLQPSATAIIEGNTGMQRADSGALSERSPIISGQPGFSGRQSGHMRAIDDIGPESWNPSSSSIEVAAGRQHEIAEDIKGALHRGEQIFAESGTRVDLSPNTAQHTAVAGPHPGHRPQMADNDSQPLTTKRLDDSTATYQSQFVPKQLTLQTHREVDISLDDASPSPMQSAKTTDRLVWDQTALAAVSLPIDSVSHPGAATRAASIPGGGVTGRVNSALHQFGAPLSPRDSYQTPLATPSVIEQEVRHVTVSIGRLEVRVNPASSPKPAATPARSGSALSDYLRERQGGGR